MANGLNLVLLVICGASSVLPMDIMIKTRDRVSYSFNCVLSLPILLKFSTFPLSLVLCGVDVSDSLNVYNHYICFPVFCR